MCIIVIKNMMTPVPSTLKTCFENNPDGAGFMLHYNGKVHGFKGLMTWNAFEEKLQEAERKFGPLEDRLMVFHFRIATHGGVNAGNTHPFPLVDSYKAMRQTEWVSNIGMAHNGIISSLSTHPDIFNHKVSDTMVFCRNVAQPVLLAKGNIKRMVEALGLMAGSKLCFMFDTGLIFTCGDFIRHTDGCMYSNDSFKPRTTKLYKLSDHFYELPWTKQEYEWTEELTLRDNKAIELGLHQLDDRYWAWFDDDTAKDMDEDWAVDTTTGDLYNWWYFDGMLGWQLQSKFGKYTLWDEDDQEVCFVD